nr:TPA_asm: RdRp [Ulva lactuca associated mitovirus 1]
MKHPKPNLNLMLLRSIPLDKDLKRYFISKYCHLVRSNGLEYANGKFKHLESCLKTLRSGHDMPSLGIRNNGWVKKLIHYMMCQPHHVLNFLKGIYSWKGDINTWETSRRYHHELGSIDSNQHKTPSFMNEWWKVLHQSQSSLRKSYQWYRSHKTSRFHRYCQWHSLSEWMTYWRHWKRRFRVTGTPTAMERPVFPEMYKDYLSSPNNTLSDSYERDFVNLCQWLAGRTDVPTAPQPSWVLDLMRRQLSDEAMNAVESHLHGDEKDMLSFKSTDFMSGVYVGDVHYIPKQGTGYRPIAVPNRFIQSGLVPIYGLLVRVLKNLPLDATYDQDKFDSVIQSRVTTDSRFIGSIDLSSATDHLPLCWIAPFVKELVANHGCEVTELSLRLFELVSRSKWHNEGYMSEWKVGQPLGTLPSFTWLSLTHHLFCEALALQIGLGHSPYRILGDDIVVFSKNFHKAYIREMLKRDIPISRHKCYSGKLTEFAGKTFIKKINPFLTPDHSIVSWQSLFDWQYSTGIRIPWDRLPKNIKRRITRYFGKLAVSGQRAYTLAQLVTVPDRGSTRHRFVDSESDDLLVHYFRLCEEETPDMPEAVLHTGMTLIQNTVGILFTDQVPLNHPLSLRERVQVISKTPLEMGGYFRRYYQTVLPDWYRKKFRPTPTDKIFSMLRIAAEEVGLSNSVDSTVNTTTIGDQCGSPWQGCNDY